MDKVKKKKEEKESVKIEFFYVKTDKPEEFVDELEQLCRKYSRRGDFYFKYSVEG